MLAAALMAGLLTGCGKISVTQTSSETTVELGDEFVFDAMQFFDVDESEAENFTADTADLDVYTVGSYDITITYNGTDYTITVNVEDTTPPEIWSEENVYFFNSYYDAAEAEIEEETDEEGSTDDGEDQDDDMESPLVHIYDLSACEVIFIDYGQVSELTPMTDSELEELFNEVYAEIEPELTFEMFEEASDDVQSEDASDGDDSEEDSDEEDSDDEEEFTEGLFLGLAACRDESGNTSYCGWLEVCDETAPVISGLEDQTIIQDDVSEELEIDLDGVTVTDNMDGEIDIDDVETELAETEEGSHIYTLTLSYTDRAGNTAEESCTVTVTDEEEEEETTAASSSGSSSSGSSSSGSSSSGSSGSNSSSSGSSSSGSSGSGSSSSSGSSGSGSSSSSGSSGSGSSSSSGSGSSSSASSSGYNDSYAQEVLTLINEERAAEGLSALTMNSTVMAAAKVRAKELATTFSHYRPDGSVCFTALDDAGVSYMACAENIAGGQTTPAQVVSEWMNSSGHRANILSSAYTQIGIGCYYENGIYYWVQLFIN